MADVVIRGGLVFDGRGGPAVRADIAIERGGHVRVGLEDYCGEDQPTNPDLVTEVVEIARAVGRPIATSDEAARILGLPR